MSGNTGWDFQLFGQFFDMITPQDVLYKIKRDKKSLDEAIKSGISNDIVDFSISFSMSAWHLHDWLFTFHKNKIAKILKIENKKKFQEFIRQKYPALQACDCISNAFKHGEKLSDQGFRPNDFFTGFAYRPQDSHNGQFAELILGAGTPEEEDESKRDHIMVQASVIFDAAIAQACALCELIENLPKGDQ